MPTLYRRIPGLLFVLWLGWFATVAAAETDSRVRLILEHLDLRISYEPGRTNLLDVLVADQDARPVRLLATTNAVLVAAESSRLTLPGDLPPLGNSGDLLWVLPASQAEGLLFLGISGEDVPSGVFNGPVGLRLLGVEGPGRFFLWQSDLGSLRFFMNSADGIDGDDVFPQLVGGHTHVDWGFSTAGVYRLTFQAEGRRIGESTNLVSPPREVTFHVLPLPAEPDSPFRRWQAARWPGVTDASVVGPESDPDGDGWPNLWEYVWDGDPRTGSSFFPDRPVASAATAGGDGESVLVTVQHAAGATDVAWECAMAERPTGPWTVLAAEPIVTDAGAGRVRRSWVVRRGAGISSFYRVGLRLKLGG